jgi:hypothetical protein
MFVLEQIDLARHRNVVLQYPLAPVMQEVRRTQVAEGPRVVNEMELIGVPAVPSHL